MTEFERKYPGQAPKTAKCPKCKKGGKSIRTRPGKDGVTDYCCGKCGDTWIDTDTGGCWECGRTGNCGCWG